MLSTKTQKDNILKNGRNNNLFFQPKLTINQPDDIYEQEADAIADKVMRMSETSSLFTDNKPFFSPPRVNINKPVAAKEKLQKKEIKEEDTKEALPEVQPKLSFDGLPLPPGDNKANNTALVQRKCAHCEEEEKKQLQRKEINSEKTEPKQKPTTYQHIDVYIQQANAKVDKVMRMREHPSLLTSNKAFFGPPTVNINKPGTAKEEPLKKVNKEKETKEAWPEIQAKLSLDGLTLSSDDKKANDKTFIQLKCAHCEEEEKLQRKEINSSGRIADTPIENYISSLNGKGRSLTNEERKFFEPRMGYDFSDVKIHRDSKATKSV